MIQRKKLHISTKKKGMHAYNNIDFNRQTVLIELQKDFYKRTSTST